MKRAMLALALGLATLSLSACDDYGYRYGGVYSAGYPHYRYYDDYYYAPAYRGYWGRGGHYYHRRDGYHHHRRDGDVRGHRFHRHDGVSRPGRDKHWRDRHGGKGGHGKWRRHRD
ncbi:MAG TPA: hypothetical protein VL918_05300 [Sphingobium sp.]|nr:hypothetical protein [Sphingobium sp.]